MEELRQAESFCDKIVKIMPWMFMGFCSGLFAGYAWAMYHYGRMI